MDNLDSIDNALTFLQQQFNNFDLEKGKWTEESKKLNSTINMLLDERSCQELVTKDLLKRIKMLEFALREERKSYCQLMDKETEKVLKQKDILMLHEKGISGTLIHDSNSSRVSLSKASNSSPGVSMLNGNKISSPPTPSMAIEEVKQNEEKKSNNLSKISPNPSSEHKTDISNEVESNISEKLRVLCSESKTLQAYKLKSKLTGHLDAVRKVCFDSRENYSVLLSGSEDGTVRFHELQSVLNPEIRQSKRSIELDSFLTFRGHKGPVLSLTTTSREFSSTFSSNPICISGGRDGNLVFWKLPERKENEHTFTKQVLSLEDHQQFILSKINAHKDAIWEISSHPLNNFFLSASADGCVTLWSLQTNNESKVNIPSLYPSKSSTFYSSINQLSGLNHCHSRDGLLIPTTAQFVQTNLRTCVIGYTSSTIAQYDLTSEKQIRNFSIPTASSVQAQVNSILTHPTLPLIISAHQDKHIRFYDIRVGKCIHEILAHQDSVSSLALDPSSLYLASTGHDGSLRFWSMSERNCINDQMIHRPKFRESIHSVSIHPSNGILASGGADGFIKIFQ